MFIPDLAQSSADTWNKVSITSRLKPHEFRTYVFDYKPTIRNDLESLVQFEKIEIHAQRLLEELRRIKTQRGEGPFAPRFVAHGYGGLVCESVGLPAVTHKLFPKNTNSVLAAGLSTEPSTI